MNIREIIKTGVVPQAEFREFLRERGNKLAESATKFVVCKYGRTRMIHALHPSGKFIPLPLNKLEDHKITNRQYVLSAMRAVIDDQIAPLRQRGMHVDHVLPFVVLAEEWARENELDLDTLKVTKSRKLKRLSLGKWDDSWATFHKEQATLQVIPKKMNLRKGSSYVH